MPSVLKLGLFTSKGLCPRGCYASFNIGVLTSQRPQVRQGHFASLKAAYWGMLGGNRKRVSALNHEPVPAKLGRAINRWNTSSYSSIAIQNENWVSGIAQPTTGLFTDISRCLESVIDLLRFPLAKLAPHQGEWRDKVVSGQPYGALMEGCLWLVRTEGLGVDEATFRATLRPPSWQDAYDSLELKA